MLFNEICWSLGDGEVTANLTHKPKYSVYQHQIQLNSAKLSREVAYVFRKLIQRRRHMGSCEQTQYIYIFLLSVH